MSNRLQEWLESQLERQEARDGIIVPESAKKLIQFLCERNNHFDEVLRHALSSIDENPDTRFKELSEDAQDNALDLIEAAAERLVIEIHRDAATAEHVLTPENEVEKFKAAIDEVIAESRISAHEAQHAKPSARGVLEAKLDIAKHLSEAPLMAVRDLREPAYDAEVLALADAIKGRVTNDIRATIIDGQDSKRPYMTDGLLSRVARQYATALLEMGDSVAVEQLSDEQITEGLLSRINTEYALDVAHNEQVSGIVKKGK